MSKAIAFSQQVHGIFSQDKCGSIDAVSCRNYNEKRKWKSDKGSDAIISEKEIWVN